jgi:simple sugar transport system substrate-binding protein
MFCGESLCVSASAAWVQSPDGDSQSLAAGAFGATSRLWTGCTAPPKQAASPTPTGEKPLTIGFIYVGSKDDYGYNQSHAEGKAAVAQLSGVQTVEEASVPETKQVAETMRNMVKDNGATVLFPTSYGYFNPHSLQIAREFPEVQLFHPNQPYKDGYPKNVGSFFSELAEPAYLAGIVAAYASKTDKLGFVVPKPIPVVLREVNSFTLGHAASSLRSSYRLFSQAIGRCLSKKQKPPIA